MSCSEVVVWFTNDRQWSSKKSANASVNLRAAVSIIHHEKYA